MNATDSLPWRAIPDRLESDDAFVLLLGLPERRTGDRWWWRCPVHDDSDPSFVKRSGEKRAHCFACRWHGDALDLARAMHPTWTIHECLEHFGKAGDPPLPIPRRTSPPTNEPSRRARQSMLDGPEALALAEKAEVGLWSSAGSRTLDYLRVRGLADDTIRKARLGWTPRLDLPGNPEGVTIPWFSGGRLVMLKIRQPEGRKPKYMECYRTTPVLYPSPEAVMPRRPAAIVEGEFDALLVGQELCGKVSVVTTGGTGSRPSSEALSALLASPTWIVAVDADEAGESSASEWMRRSPRCVRLTPPKLPRVDGPGVMEKDWSDVFAGGENRIRYYFGGLVDLSGA